MKKLITILVLIITTTLFVGCEDATNEAKDSGITLYDGDISLDEVEIDGCEYLIYSRIKQFGMTHKGNCKNH